MQANRAPVSAEPESTADESSGLLVLALLSLIIGAAVGLVCALFRLALVQGDAIRNVLVSWAQGGSWAGLLVVAGSCGAAAALAAWLVRRFSPDAVGSGIPQVEAVMSGEERASPLRRAWVKFVGGVLAIGGGLALGREGPSVQMGAGIANMLATVCRRNWHDSRVLFAAGAGAGLATAFNAPIAGAVFVLEELVRRFDMRTAVAALGASAGAIAVARVLLGVLPDFHVAPQPYPGLATVPIHLVLGIIAGILGAAYSRVVLSSLAVADATHWLPVEARAALVGIAVGALAWFAPDLVGGGDALTQRALDAKEAPVLIVVVFVVRFALGPVCYAAGTPGGLFAPMLVLGAQIGVVFGWVCHQWLPGDAASATAYAVVGMAAFFTAVVRAPLTGIVLAVEMTGCWTLLLPMLTSCFAAMATATLLRSPPIYDSLKERAAKLAAP